MAKFWFLFILLQTTVTGDANVDTADARTPTSYHYYSGEPSKDNYGRNEQSSLTPFDVNSFWGTMATDDDVINESEDQPDDYDDDYESEADIRGDDDLGNYYLSRSDDEDEDSGVSLQKRYLGALARAGDRIASRITAPNGPYSTGTNEDGTSRDLDTSSNDQMKDTDEKRHIASLARSGSFSKLRQTSSRPKSLNNYNSWTGKSKRFNNIYEYEPTDDDDDDDDDNEDLAPDNVNEEDLYSMVKRNIAALARRGTMTKLREQRRPVPWISDEDYHDYGGRQHSHDDFKRNIQTLARIATPGSGFRSWLRGQLHPKSGMGNKRRYYHHGSRGGKYGRFGKGSVRGKDRFRGVRSTKDHYDVIATPSISRMTASGFRAPMAFVSKHVWKRAINDVIRPYLQAQHEQDTSNVVPDKDVDNQNMSSNEIKKQVITPTPPGGAFPEINHTV